MKLMYEYCPNCRGKFNFAKPDKVNGQCPFCATIVSGCYEEEKSPQNLPQPDAYSLLADVRAAIKQLYINTDGRIKFKFDSGYNEAIKNVLKILDEHFS